MNRGNEAAVLIEMDERFHLLHGQVEELKRQVRYLAPDTQVTVREALVRLETEASEGMRCTEKLRNASQEARQRGLSKVEQIMERIREGFAMTVQAMTASRGSMPRGTLRSTVDG